MNDIDQTITLGTPEAAVHSCVNLFSRLFNVPEDYVACYLDMYYQLRRQAEHAKALSVTAADGGDSSPQRGSQGGAEESKEPQGALSGKAHHERPARPDPGRSAHPNLDASGQEETGEDRVPLLPEVFSGFEPLEIKPGGHKGAAEAAAEKRRIRERLTQARAKGVTVKQIVKAGNGNITEDQIREILDSRKVPIAVYRVLDGALGVLEAAAGST